MRSGEHVAGQPAPGLERLGALALVHLLEVVLVALRQRADCSLDHGRAEQGGAVHGRQLRGVFGHVVIVACPPLR